VALLAQVISVLVTTKNIAMVLMTMVARITDGLPLAASIQEDDEVCNATRALIWKIRQSTHRNFPFQLGKNVVEYQNQAKRLFKTLSRTSPVKCSIESGHYMFQ
jgi:vesicle transport protein SEC22